MTINLTDATVDDMAGRTVGVTIGHAASPMQSLTLPAALTTIQDWLPDLDLTEAAAQFALDSGAFGSVIEVTDVDGDALASAFVFLRPSTGALDAVAGLFFDRAIDLGATPLLGPLLTGVRLSELGVTYASRAFTAGEILLPAGAPAVDSDVPVGLTLGLTLTAAGAQQQLRLSSGASAPAAVSSRRADDAPAADGPSVHWFPVDKSFGPLTVARVGLVGASGTLGLAVDAALDLDVVAIALQGLRVGVDLAASSPAAAVSLDGLAVDVSVGELTIAGSLARTVGAGEEFDGSLVIQLGAYAIKAAGSYAFVDGAPSLFVYGLAEGEFGGPPAFFVTGLAAGFGLNRSLRLPEASAVAKFPLIAAATGSGPTGTEDALAQLSSGGWVPPKLGETWIAAGVAFTSFEMIDGFALLTVEFGMGGLVLALLGTATLELPTPADPGATFARVEITLEAVLDVAGGSVSVIALLTPNSYIINPSCVLTGGIAYGQWFGANPHAGDVVFTAGGYNPLFSKPDHYPDVPRLGFRWKVSDVLQIAGEAYFAITPSCVMGGGRLAVTFAADSLHAWLVVQADFILYWRPMWFEVDIAVSVGVSLTVNVAFAQTTLSVELGVSVRLWGPAVSGAPLQGIAHVDWAVISFDIAINPSPAGTEPPPLDWSTFATTSLPAASSICRARPASGLHRIATMSTGEQVWVFGGDLIRLTTQSVIPAGQVVVVGPSEATTTSAPPTPQAVNVYPLGNVQVSATQLVRLAAWTPATDWQPGGALPPALDVSDWEWTVVIAPLPAALWGARGTEVGPVLGPKDPVAAVVGVSGTAPGPVVTGGLTVAAGTLEITPLPTRDLPLSTTAPSDQHGPPVAGDSRATVAAMVDDPSVAAVRAAVVAVALECSAGAGLQGGSLDNLSTEVFAALSAPPMIGPLGSTGPQAPTVAAEPTASTPGRVPASTTADPAASRVGVQLRAVFRSYRSVGDAASGSVLSAIVADRWSTGAERRAVERLARAIDSLPAPRWLWPGWTAVWDLDDDTPTLHMDPADELWLVALDAGQHVLRSTTLPAGENIWTPPPGTWRVIATLAERGGERAAGWHYTAPLRQVSSQVFLGEGCLVRRLDPGPLHRSRCRRDIGVSSGRRLLDGGATAGSSRPLRTGPVDTYFARCRAVVVGIAPSPDAPRSGGVAGPTVSWHTGRPGSVARPLPPRSAKFATRAPARWLHTVADDEVPRDGVVRAAAPPGWRLDGVFAVADSEPADSEPAVSGDDGPTGPPLRRIAGPRAGADTATAPSRVWWR